MHETRGKRVIAKSIVSLKFEPKGKKHTLTSARAAGRSALGSGAGSSRRVRIPHAEDGFSTAKFPVPHI